MKFMNVHSQCTEWGGECAPRGLLIGMTAILSSALLSGCSGSGVQDSSGIVKSHPSYADAKPPNEWGTETGETLAQCRRRIGWSEISTSQVLSTYPFDRMMGFVPTSRAVVWSDGKKRANGWPRYLFGVFSDEGKHHLIDLIELSDGSKIPRVAGVYNANLEALRAGISVQDLRRSVGVEDDCEYESSANGKWLVRLRYQGFWGKMFVIEVDAATGIVVSAGNKAI